MGLHSKRITFIPTHYVRMLKELIVRFEDEIIITSLPTVIMFWTFFDLIAANTNCSYKVKVRYLSHTCCVQVD